jgi:DNA polymerase III subunit chi
MAEVFFYHLTESRLDEVLPGLLEKTVERGWKAIVQCGTEEFRDTLDEKLWTFSEASFIAHATDEHADASAQPVILTTQSANANNADVRFIVDGAVPPDLTAYTRAVLVFDGHDEGQKADARESWTKLKGEGHDVTYWQQNADRRWEKKGQ